MVGGTLGWNFNWENYIALSVFVSYNDQSVFPNYSQTMPFVLGIRGEFGSWSEESEAEEDVQERQAL